MLAVYKKMRLSRRILSRNPKKSSTRGILRGLIGLVAIGICLAILPLRTHIQADEPKVPPTEKMIQDQEDDAGNFFRDPKLALDYLQNDFVGPLQQVTQSSPMLRASFNAMPRAVTFTPGAIYDQLVFRQSDCSITDAVGQFTLSFQAMLTVPDYQTVLREASGLTPSTPANAYANGCSNSTIGAMSTRSSIFTTQLANGNYVGATLENSGINTFVSQQLNGFVSTAYVDTSNGDANAGPFGLGSADLNGDGIPDLVVSNSDLSASSAGNTLAVLLGKSDGTFQAPTYTTHCRRPCSAVLRS